VGGGCWAGREWAFGAGLVLAAGGFRCLVLCLAAEVGEVLVPQNYLGAPLKSLERRNNRTDRPKLCPGFCPLGDFSIVPRIIP